MLDATIASNMSFEELAVTLWARQNNLTLLSVQYIPIDEMDEATRQKYEQHRKALAETEKRRTRSHGTKK